jgi:hypothetical protein
MTRQRWERLMESDRDVRELPVPGFGTPEYGGSDRLPGEADEEPEPGGSKL